MSVCETPHWILDCGEGSGCLLFEGEHGEVLAWHCSQPTTVSARRKSPGMERLVLDDPSQKLTLCYQDLERSAIAEVLGELTGSSFVVLESEGAGTQMMCETGTFDELLQASGLRRQEPSPAS